MFLFVLLILLLYNKKRNIQKENIINMNEKEQKETRVYEIHSLQRKVPSESKPVQCPRGNTNNSERTDRR